MFTPIKVLVVDDSALIRRMLVRALGLDPRIEIVGIAKTGVEAIEQARRLSPDVITLDIQMPELTGLEALPHLAKHTDARVIMLSSLDDPETTYQALELGAVDFIAKPKGGFASSLTELADLLIKKIKTAYRVSPETVREAHEAVSAPAPVSEAAAGTAKAGTAVARRTGAAGERAAEERATELETLVVIAASTGGPPALEAVLSRLDASLPAAYLIVQHLPAGFSRSFADRLARVTDVEVREAVPGEPVLPGTAYLAPHGRHMSVFRDPSRRLRVALEEGEPIHGLLPAADPLFASAAEEFDPVVGVVLTGMGVDAAAGMRAIVDRGGLTIAQDETTSVVWGMPGEAVKRGAVSRVVPLQSVAVEIRRAVRGGVLERG